MGVFSKESLERLRAHVDLIELISSYIELKPSGSTYKACCPFHGEKTPSFHVKRGDSHYHCFGCNAHGDAIAFLMSYLSISFVEATLMLSERFGVHMDVLETKEPGIDRRALKDANLIAADFYQAMLLHTDEGHFALNYLYKRGMDLDFIKHFKVGYAPKNGPLFLQFMKEKGVSLKLVEQAGLIKNGRPLFFGRVMFPIQDASGAIIGFSGRKLVSTGDGPKYVNTPETPIFKKSRVLFGLSESRRRIAKEKQVLIVEGQIDALRLIQEGFDFTVAGQGTAFGTDHTAELIKLGVTHAILGFDGDDAGRSAALKVGNLFQKAGAQVSVLVMPAGSDPDSLLQEKGPLGMKELIDRGMDYLSFLVGELAKTHDIHSPTGKNQIVKEVKDRVKHWDHPLIVHESLRRLAHLVNVPEKLIGMEQEKQENVFIKRTGAISDIRIDPDRILETDLLRWLYLKPEFGTLIKKNLTLEHFRVSVCRRLYRKYLENEKAFFDSPLKIDDPEEKLCLSDILSRQVNLDRAEEGVETTILKILERRWMMEREAIKMQIHSGQLRDDEVFKLAKDFDRLKNETPHLLR